MSFTIFDTRLDTSKPDLAPYGLNTHIAVLYQAAIYSPDSASSALPPQATVEGLIAGLSLATTHVVLDIETGMSIANFVTVCGWVKGIRPDIKVGFYGYGPALSANVGIVFGSGSGSYTTWQAGNDDLEPLIDVIDFHAPTWYFRNARPREIMVNLAASMIEGRRIGQSKPIYPFVWPRYHDVLYAFGFDVNVPGGMFSEFLRFLKTGQIPANINKGTFWSDTWLQTTGVDGCLLWGGYLQAWDANAPWWDRTQRFINTARVRAR